MITFSDRHSGATDEVKKSEELLFKEVCLFYCCRQHSFNMLMYSANLAIYLCVLGVLRIKRCG